MSPYLPEAVIATEDRRFYTISASTRFGLLRAALADLAAGHVVQGGSTITQQLAKILFLTPERSLARKIRETLLALWLEHRFTKDQILEIYLNRVYLGAGTYGVDAAAHRYFGKSARRARSVRKRGDRRTAEGADAVQPGARPRAAAARAAQVLANMVEAGYITAEQAAAAERSEERALAGVA